MRIGIEKLEWRFSVNLDMDTLYQQVCVWVCVGLRALISASVSAPAGQISLHYSYLVNPDWSVCLRTPLCLLLWTGLNVNMKEARCMQNMEGR